MNKISSQLQFSGNIADHLLQVVLTQRHRLVSMLSLALLVCSAWKAPAATMIAPVERPQQSKRSAVSARLKEASNHIGAAQARSEFNVDGTGLTVAVIDSGLRTTHVDFAGRIAAQHNFTAHGGDASDVSDDHGHGTNVAGIILSNGDHTGIAPGARVIPLKVFDQTGSGSFTDIKDALQWVLDHKDTYNISAVNLSLGDGGNYSAPTTGSFATLLSKLRSARIAVVVAAGNGFHSNASQPGMSFPANLPACISVGAVFDGNRGGFSYGSGAQAFTTGIDRIAPFSQRLPENVHAEARTDVFAPGAPITSSGILDDHGESTKHGTSQAAPIVTGLVLLLQQYHLRATGELPTVEFLESVLRDSAALIVDGDDEDDNVENTQATFHRVDALSALRTISGQPSSPNRLPNGAPQFTSPPVVTPTPARAGMPVSFLGLATDPEGDALQYEWVLGDGTTQSGPSIQHTYAAAGTYEVTLKVSDGNSETLELLTVEVLSKVQALLVKSFKVKLNFKSEGRDACKLKASLDLPEDFNPEGTQLTAQIGATSFGFTLNQKGRALAANGKLLLKTKGKTGLSLSLNNGDWASDWAALGLENEDRKNILMTLPITIIIGSHAYHKDCPISYSARKGVVGVGR